MKTIWIISRIAAGMSSTTSARSKTAADIAHIFAELDLDEVARHFGTDADEIEPFVVCGGVSVNAFNEYIGDGEGLRVSLRCLCLSEDGRILIVELPTKVHDITADQFKYKFMAASGNEDEVGSRGSMTAHRPANPDKEADATFGPLNDTPNRTRSPTPRTVTDWVTLAVEIGRSQTWASLEEAAEWWCNYEGIQYILLLKISATGIRMQYALYDIAVHGILPAPTAFDTIHRSHNGQPAATINFDMHRILSIPSNQPLPNGVNPVAVVDLRVVMNVVIRNLGRS